MYLYCNNNFINYIDSTGYFIGADLLVAVLAGVALLVNSASRAKQKSKEIKRVQTKNNEKKVCPSPQYSVNFDKALKKNAKKIVEESAKMNSSEKLLYFIDQVKSGSKYDLKTQAEWSGDLYYDGMWMESQDIGNYNFGYIGRAMGYSTSFLILGAGAYQVKEGTYELRDCLTISLCDDPRDTYFIIKGALKYDSEH